MRTATLLLLSALAASCVKAQQMPLKLWYDKPATYFEEALPIGNGTLGALVYGDPDNDIVCLNDLTFWTGKPVERTDTAAYRWIPKIREALFREDYRTADSLQHYVQGHNSQYYQPLGTLSIRDMNHGQASGYYRELDIDSAICSDRYVRNGIRFTRTYLASHPDSLIAIHLTASGRGQLNFRLSLSAKVPHQVKASKNGQLTMTGYATGKPEESIHFCTVVRVDHPDGTIEASDSTLTLHDMTEATVYIVNATSFNGFNRHPVREGAPYLERAMDRTWHTVNGTFREFRDRHIADYRALFARLSLRIGSGKPDQTRPTDRQLLDYTDGGGYNPYLETLYFQYGRYLLIASSRTPGVPANLQGLWATRLFSPWRGNYTVNINLEENYWPAETANLPEMTMPLEGFVRALSINGRNTARDYYGIDRGWCSSHNSDIWAMTNPVGEKRESPEWSNWNMGGAWLVNTLWEHYQFTQDKEYLRSTALPLMKGAADFMMEWLVDNPKRPGELITAPSTSPENEYKTPDGYHGTTCYGGTADLAIIRELLTNTRAAIAALSPKPTRRNASGTGNAEADKTYTLCIDSILTRLHPYTVGKNGDLNEWYYDWDDWDIRHRHQSHLIGLYPGSHITPDRTPDLARAAAATLRQKGDLTTGWSTGWRINLWARLHDGEQAYHFYRKLLTYVSPDDYKGKDRRRSGGTYPNLFDAHPPFQIDGNFGGTAGVCEMLIQSHGDAIELLPALPAAWPEGEISGVKARGGYTLRFAWKDGRVTEAGVQGSRKAKVKLMMNGSTRVVKVREGKETVIR